MTHVMACIDNSQSSVAVCDYAVWASQRLDAPLTLLHVLDEEKYPAGADLSGSIGLGSREHLPEELATPDARRGRLALEKGQDMREKARERTVLGGAALPHRHSAADGTSVDDREGVGERHYIKTQQALPTRYDMTLKL